MNTVTNRSGNDNGRGVVLNITPSQKPQEHKAVVPVRREDTKSTCSLHNTPLQILTIFNLNSSMWFPIAAHLASPTAENGQRKLFMHPTPNPTHKQLRVKRTFDSLRTSWKGSHFQKSRKRADGRGSQPLPIPTLQLSAVQSKYDANRKCHFKLPSGHTKTVKRKPDCF